MAANNVITVMKWKERVALSLGVSVVLLTSVLVLDIRYASSGGRADRLDSGFILPVLRHGSSRQKDGKEFQRQFLDKPADAVHPVPSQTAAVNEEVDGVTVSNATINDDDPAAQQR